MYSIIFELTTPSPPQIQQHFMWQGTGKSLDASVRDRPFVQISINMKWHVCEVSLQSANSLTDDVLTKSSVSVEFHGCNRMRDINLYYCLGLTSFPRSTGLWSVCRPSFLAKVMDAACCGHVVFSRIFGLQTNSRTTQPFKSSIKTGQILAQRYRSRGTEMILGTLSFDSITKYIEQDEVGAVLRF